MYEMINTNDKFDISNRRYIGCKAKLSDWIMGIIKHNTINAHSFCDLFAGTGIMAKIVLDSGLYNKVIVNDFLLSNYIIYIAFMGHGEWNSQKLDIIIKQFNDIKDEEINENWFSYNYGDKYFDIKTAKRIGFIRDEIETIKNKLTDKEYAILITSLIYSIDKLANTVGHYDSYIRKTINPKRMILKLINARDYPNVTIFKEDANILARTITADIIYLDPPYNSRQYSRFYHIYETIIKWNRPKLYGVALKPEPTNMSEYCRVGAYKAFKDLIHNLNTKYIAVSYNNTYKSKSHSSENKITLEQIKNSLNEIGETRIFTHKYNAFNAGNTDFKDHKEYLFLTKVTKKQYEEERSRI